MHDYFLSFLLKEEEVAFFHLLCELEGILTNRLWFNIKSSRKRSNQRVLGEYDAPVSATSNGKKADSIVVKCVSNNLVIPCLTRSNKSWWTKLPWNLCLLLNSLSSGSLDAHTLVQTQPGKKNWKICRSCFSLY